MVRHFFHIVSLVLFFTFLMGKGIAQVVRKNPVDSLSTVVDSVWTVQLKDTMGYATDSVVSKVLESADTLQQPSIEMQPVFKPDPQKAVLYALVPGLGQIYNRKFWKLPLVYGGLMGCMYAITWNNKNYKDYSTAYFDVINDYEKVRENSEYDGPWQSSWIAFVPEGTEKDYVKNTQFHDNLKRGKDYYRRYRDLSIIITVGVYALSIIDAYIDAHLFDFDISPDLSLHWSPEAAPKTRHNDSYYGLNCSLKF